MSGVAGLVAALGYSSFPLAGPLGSTLDPTTSYVSGLGAPQAAGECVLQAVDMSRAG
jgi:hypothetical protein